MKIQALLLCCNIAIAPALAVASSNIPAPAASTTAAPGQRIRVRATADNTYEAEQAADLLNIRDKVTKLHSLEGDPSANPMELVRLRVSIFKRILLGFIEVRRSCNKIDFELAYTYDRMQRQQRKQAAVNDALNLLNFEQFGTQYTLGSYSRLKHNFNQSAIYTCVSSGVGLILPTVGIIYNKTAKAHNLTPPQFMDKVLDGGPVSVATLPPLMQQFMETHESGEALSRKQRMYDLWKTRYHIDATKESQLCALNDGKPKSIGQLNTRIMLLWSLHTYVQDFDQLLLALSQSVTMPQAERPTEKPGWHIASLTRGGNEAARLLHIESLADKLNNPAGLTDLQRVELEARAYENILSGALDMRIAADQCDEELNYAYDVALSELTYKRGSGLQKNFELNFIKTGFLGGTAGMMYAKGYPKVGNELFLINAAVGTALSTIALFQLHGGWRKRDTPPNSLADFFNLDVPQEYQFSPLASAFLNSPTPQSTTGESHKELLMRIWKQNHVSTVDLNKKENLERLAAMPDTKRDTINFLRNRIRMLTSLKAELELFDDELYDIAKFVETHANTKNDVNEVVASSTLGAHARQISDILGVRELAEHQSQPSEKSSEKDEHALEDTVAIAGRILLTSLDIRRTADKLDLQIAKETQTLDRMSRNRDLLIAMTNNANFFQLGVFSMIQDGPLGLSGNPTLNLAAIKLNIVSGMMVDCFAVATVPEKRGGYRPNKPEPNNLADCFNLPLPSGTTFSPEIKQYFNAVPPGSSLSRRDQLVQYWKTGKIVSANINDPSTQKRLAALRGSRWFSESIGLIQNRLVMLYDVSAVVDSMDIGLCELLESIS